jgi:hypothetical protein
MSAPSPVRVLYARLRTAQPWMQSAPLVEQSLSRWPHGRCMGVFMGLFGLGNHELLVLLSVPPDAGSINDWRADLSACLPAEVRVLEAMPLRATVRPASDAPFTRAGVHVFRWFTLPLSRVSEAVALSSAGWETFERNEDPSAGDGYRTEPLGLFAQDGPRWCHDDARPEQAASSGWDPLGPGQLLLLTWYDSMTSWERSRTPNPQATANFRKRAALTSSIVAYATRLAHTA